MKPKNSGVGVVDFNLCAEAPFQADPIYCPQYISPRVSCEITKSRQDVAQNSNTALDNTSPNTTPRPRS